MKVVGTGFCRNQHGGSRPGPVFGGVSVGQNLELPNVIDRRENADTPSSQFVIVDAIQQPVCAVRTGAANRQRKRSACGYLTAGSRSEETAGIGLCRSAGSERGKLNEIAAIQGQQRYLLRVDNLAERWIGCLDSYGFTGDCHRGDYRRRREGKIEFARFVPMKFEIFGLSTLKVGEVHANGVNADGKQREQVVAGTICLRVASKASSLGGGCDSGPYNARS